VRLNALVAAMVVAAATACSSSEPRSEGDLLVTARRVFDVGTLHVIECPAAVTNMAAFVRAGGVLLYATDFPNEGIAAGIDVEELRLMTRAGLSREQAIAAATSGAGRQLGRGPLGSLAPGGPADVVGVAGDPFRDLGALERVVFLSAGGWIVIERGKVDLPVQ
jgi:imidazolonepropionase-like amidohydrolase